MIVWMEKTLQQVVTKCSMGKPMAMLMIKFSKLVRTLAMKKTHGQNSFWNWNVMEITAMIINKIKGGSQLPK